MLICHFGILLWNNGLVVVLHVVGVGQQLRRRLLEELTLLLLILIITVTVHILLILIDNFVLVVLSTIIIWLVVLLVQFWLNCILWRRAVRGNAANLILIVRCIKLLQVMLRWLLHAHCWTAVVLDWRHTMLLDLLLLYLRVEGRLGWFNVLLVR
jgi:hypothetical protein